MRALAVIILLLGSLSVATDCAAQSVKQPGHDLSDAHSQTAATEQVADVEFQEGENAEGEIDFDRQIRPILSDRCYFCHGPDGQRREAGLRLDDRDEALNVIEPGAPEDSELLRRIESDDADEVMPPPESKITVTPEERELIRKWIAQGAKWKKHWAFQKRTRPTPPIVKDVGKVANEIDQFVLAKLESEKFTLAGVATKEQLIRRATFDLTGLPPTIEEIDSFLADTSSNAYEKVVDRLLASPQYGQRMASDWLDIARYSDTYGYQVDRDRFVWPWRDWVIRSFNRNQRYDEFLTHQLAGDLLPDATDDQILATTFNRLHPQKVEGGSVEEEFRVEYVADRAQTFATAFLGLTLECARCHDHKFDPLSQKEYYELFAFFNNIDEAGLYSYFTSSVPTPTLALANEKQAAAVRELQEELQAINFRGESEVEVAKLVAALESASPAPIEDVNFETVKIGRSQRVKDDAGRPAVKLTGDDAVNLKTGNFRRFQPFSVAIKFNTPDVKERAVIFHRSRAWTDAASRGYQLLIEEGKLSASLIHFWPGNAISVRTKEAIPVKQWLDVAVVYDGSMQASGIQIFVNGKLQAVEIVKDKLTRNITGGGGDHLAIGERFRDRGFQGGMVSAMQVFDRQLSSFEVAGLHNPQVADQWKRALTDPNAEAFEAIKRQSLEHYLLSVSEPHRLYRDALKNHRERLCKQLDGIQEVMVMRELPEPRQAYILNRGVYDQRGSAVSAATPAVLPPMDPELPRNRLGLAKWLTERDHPLTSRVAVNHFWQLIFGDGLVRTPEDFGRQGSLPTHPELLDWLAEDFVDHGWDVKRLLKQLVMSSTYRQSSHASPELLKVDPDNHWLGRAPAYRLSAEMLRDNVLAVSGLLVDRIGGPPVRPYELAASFKPVAPDAGEGLYRRSLYTYWKRTGPAPVMLALDAAKRDVCRVKRERTSSPLQALAMLNGPQFVEASRAMADRVIEKHGSESLDQIATELFRSLTSRTPLPEELKIVKQLYRAQLAYFGEDRQRADKYLAVGQYGDFTEPGLSVPANKHDIRIGADSEGHSLFRGEVGRIEISPGLLNETEIARRFKMGRAANVEHQPILSNQKTAGFKMKSVGNANETLDGGHFVFPKTSEFDFGESFTLEAWVKPRAMGGRILDKITPGKGDGLLLDLHQGLRLICGDVLLQAERAPEVGKWSHIACTLSRGRATIFLNGEMVGRKVLNVSMAKQKTDPVVLAAWSSVVNTLINHDECVMKR